MTGKESVDCPHCGKEIELPMAVEDGTVFKYTRGKPYKKLGGPMAH